MLNFDNERIATCTREVNFPSVKALKRLCIYNPEGSLDFRQTNRTVKRVFDANADTFDHPVFNFA